MIKYIIVDIIKQQASKQDKTRVPLAGTKIWLLCAILEFSDADQGVNADIKVITIAGIFSLKKQIDQKI